jgi:hypothetical protein
LESGRSKADPDAFVLNLPETLIPYQIVRVAAHQAGLAGQLDIYRDFAGVFHGRAA